MCNKYSGMSWDEHVELGRLLKRARIAILKASCKYPKAHGVTTSARSAEKKLLTLLSDLDDQVGVDCPSGHTDRELNRVYFGGV